MPPFANSPLSGGLCCGILSLHNIGKWQEFFCFDFFIFPVHRKDHFAFRHIILQDLAAISAWGG